MNTQTRIRTCRLVEKINQHEAYSQKLGLTDRSTFRGIVIRKEEVKQHD